GDRVASLQHFETASKLEPTNLDIKLEMAAELRDRGDFDGAHAVVAAVLETCPDHFHAWMHLGHLHRRRGNRTNALEAFETAQRRHPGKAAAVVEVAIEMRAAGRPAESKKLIERALDLEPDHFGTLMQLIEHARLAEHGDAVRALVQRLLDRHAGQLQAH